MQPGKTPFNCEVAQNWTGCKLHFTRDGYGVKAEAAIAAKRADYFAAGTLVVWDVDLLNEVVVKVYRASDPDCPPLYQRGEMAEAEPAVPIWTMPVDDLFAQIQM